MTHEVDIKQLRRRATSGARWTATATGVRVVLQFVQLAILARLLRVEDFGLMAIANVVLAFAVAFSDAGVSNAIIHYRDAKREELSSLYWLNVVGGIVIFGGMWLAAPWIAHFYHQPTLDPVLRATSVIFIIGPLGQQFQVLFERDLRFRRLAGIEIVSMVASSAVGIVLAWRGFGVWSLVWSGVLGSALRSLALAVLGWSQWRPMFRFVPRECKRFLHFGAYQMGERVVNLGGQHLDKLVIGFLLGPAPLGYYELAYRFISRPYQIINSLFTRVAFPVFSTVQHDRTRLRKGYLELIEALGAVTIPLYVAMLALAEPIVGVQLGPRYGTTVSLLQILWIVGLSFSLTSPAGTLLLASGRADIGFYVNLVRTALIIVGVWVGSHWGLVGIAWALVAVVVAVMFPVQAYVRWLVVGMGWREFLSRLAPFFGAASVAAVVCLAANRWLPFPTDLAELAVMLPVAAAIYAGLLWWRHRTRIRAIIRLIRS
ncbi:MAG TPA: MOP flippase family protein [Candidatus Krumholzibacteria bacterium]|nr:MOP flippase family protein [Candidatus Krumholzibacteria bacterium]